VVAVAINRSDQVLACYGHAAVDVQRPMEGQTRFEIGSLTKTFTGLLLAQMAQAGEVGYDDPIIAYLPAHAVSGKLAAGQITLVKLATHTGGLPRLPPNLDWQTSPSDPYASYCLADLYHATACLEPGNSSEATVSYSTFGIGLLGQLLANAANHPYPRLLADRICRPLGLTATTAQRLSDETSRCATGYDRGRPVSPWHFDALVAAGGLRSTGADLLAYLQAHLHPQSTRLAGALLATQKPRRPTGKNMMCLVWNHRVIQERTLLWHTGGTGGFTTFVGFCPETSVGIAVLANTKHTTDQTVLRVGRRLFKHLVFPP
jgi:CubicO group peptidase (beta-lactamase class C family)